MSAGKISNLAKLTQPSEPLPKFMERYIRATSPSDEFKYQENCVRKIGRFFQDEPDETIKERVFGKFLSLLDSKSMKLSYIYEEHFLGIVQEEKRLFDSEVNLRSRIEIEKIKSLERILSEGGKWKLLSLDGKKLRMDENTLPSSIVGSYYQIHTHRYHVGRIMFAILGYDRRV